MKTSTLLLATLGLTFASLSAQTVPEFLNYQGTVTDSAGLGLGDTAPENRKVLFRVYNAALAGALVWAEEQTVTISKGEFSVLLGQGIQFASEPHDSLLDVFGNGATDRYLEITVDNGDGTLNGSDLVIAPRQRITSTAYSFRAGTADSIASGSSLKLNSADSGLGYFDSSRLFGGISVNGPVLYGAGGGALGVDNGAGTQTAALRWNSSGNVGIGSANLSGAAATTKLVLQGDDSNTAPQQLNIRGNSDTNKRLLLGYNTTSNYGSLQAYSAASTTSKLLLNPSGSTVGIGTNNPTTGAALEVNGSISASSLNLTSGDSNTAFGAASLANNTIGNQNTGIGRYALFANTTGIRNTAVGYAAFDAGTTAKDNTAVGDHALSATTNGDYNTAVGSGSLESNTTGIGNVAIGNQAGYTLTTGNLNIAIGYQAGWALTTGGNNIAIGNSGTAGTSNKIWLGSSANHTQTILAGNVGIGTDSPTKAKLEVNGAAGNHTLTSTFREYSKNSAGGVGTLPNSTGANSFYASGRLTGQDFIAFSDARIKHVEGRSDSARDLVALQGIEITDYTYIDTVSKGSGEFKKVIAQQVEKVYPQAVSRSTDEVPDIYKKATIKDGWVMLATDLKKGERVRLIGEKNNDGIHEVLEVEKDKFRTAFATEGNEVFVYGREVDDFRSVDYEAIAMLNVSATQELARQLDAKNDVIESLRSENTSLAERLAELESKDAARDARLAAIEQLLSAK